MHESRQDSLQLQPVGAATTHQAPTVYFASDFDDPRVSADRWDAALARSRTHTLNQTRQWLRAWWETMGRGELLLAVVENSGQCVMIAPCYIDEGLVLFLGAGASDYLDFIGDTSDPVVLNAVITAIRSRAPQLVGLRFHLVPESSATTQSLRSIAPLIGMEFHSHGEPLPAFEVDMNAHAVVMQQATQRSMLKREEYFRRNGTLEVTRFHQAADAAKHLSDFFRQHQERWSGTGYESPFSNATQRTWLERVCDLTADAGWLRGVRLDWNGSLLGISFAWYYRGTHYSGPWSFAREHAKHCPGHVLLRHNVLGALSENLSTYDLRGGDDHYKSRFPTIAKQTSDWGLYYP